jgi:pyridoxine kinase
VFGLLQHTEDAGSRETLLVSVQEEFVAPTRTLAVDEA